MASLPTKATATKVDCAPPRSEESSSLTHFVHRVDFRELLRCDLVQQFLEEREDSLGCPFHCTCAVSEGCERTIPGLDEESIIVLRTALLGTSCAIRLDTHRLQL